MTREDYDDWAAEFRIQRPHQQPPTFEQACEMQSLFDIPDSLFQMKEESDAR